MNSSLTVGVPSRRCEQTEVGSLMWEPRIACALKHFGGVLTFSSSFAILSRLATSMEDFRSCAATNN